MTRKFDAMNGAGFKTIYTLLIVLLISVFVVQAFWLRNFYLQKKYEFGQTVYSVMDELGRKIQERRRLDAVKMTYIIVGNDTVVKTPSRRLEIRTEQGTRVINKNLERVVAREVAKLHGPEKDIDSIFIDGFDRNVSIKLPRGEKGKTSILINSGRTDKIGERRMNQDMKMLDSLLRDEKEKQRQLLDKMITEIKVMDTETENTDTLRSLIRRDLQNRGIFQDFEFSIERKKGDSLVTRLSSDAFDSTVYSYKSDLTIRSLLGTREYLLIQFPGKNDFVLSGMRNSLILSLCFSILMLGVFTYVIRLIARQKKLSEIRNDFVNNMTHELKTPIATISLAVDALSNPAVKNDETKFGEYTRILKEEYKKLNDHVERVLQLSLLEKGELRISQVPVDLAALAASCIRAFGLLIEEKNARVDLHTENGPVMVNGDPEHLSAVISNLLDNALKYGGERPAITVSLKREKNEVLLSVKDAGIGIEQDKQRKIFEKFYRVQGGELHDVKGFGIGLSYVRSIVEAHRGRMILNSEPDRGSEFIIALERYDKGITG